MSIKAQIVYKAPKKIISMYNDSDLDFYTLAEGSQVLKLLKKYTPSQEGPFSFESCYIGRPSIKIPSGGYLFVARDQFLEDYRLN